MQCSRIFLTNNNGTVCKNDTFDLFFLLKVGDSKLTGRNSLRSVVGLDPALRGVHTTGTVSSHFRSFGGDAFRSGLSCDITLGVDSVLLPGDHTPTNPKYTILEILQTFCFYSKAVHGHAIYS